MVKIIIIALVLIAIFSSALYLGIFDLVGLQIGVFKTDFIAFIPIPLRLAFFMIILGIIVGTVKVFID